MRITDNDGDRAARIVAEFDGDWKRSALCAAHPGYTVWAIYGGTDRHGSIFFTLEVANDDGDQRELALYFDQSGDSDDDRTAIDADFTEWLDMMSGATDWAEWIDSTPDLWRD